MAEDVRVKLWLDGGRRFAAEVRGGAREVRRLGREFKETNRDARGASNGLGLVQRVMGLIKPAALIAGLGLAAGGLSAVAAGGVAVGSALGPMVGVLAPAAAGMVALKTSMGLVKVAGMGLAPVFKDFKKSMSQQTPDVSALKQTLDGLTPSLLRLKSAVQGRILGGFSDGMKSASPLVAKLSPALKTTSSVLGGLARQAGAVAAGLGGPLSRILTTNAGLIRNVGRAGLNAAIIFVRILDAARPLTAWLGRMALGWSKSALAATRAGAASGKLAGFFEKTRAVLSRVFSIVGNLARGLYGVGRAASGMGGSLLGSIDAASARFARFTNSVRGQTGLRKFFADAEPVIRQVAGLAGDLAGAFARLSVGAGGGLAPLLAKLREVVPILERILMGTTAAFGPVLVDAIVAFAQALEPLIGSSGPVIMLVKGMTMLARAATWVANTVPGGSAAITALFGAIAVSQAVGLASFVSGMFGAGRGITAVKSAAIVAKGAMVAFNATTLGTRVGLAALSVQSGITAVATRGLAGAQRVLNFVMKQNVFVRVATLLVALGAALVVAYRRSETFRRIVNGAFNAVKTAAGTVVGAVIGHFRRMIGFYTGIPGRIAGVAGRLFAGIKSAASTAVSFVAGRFRDLIGFFQRLPAAIANAISSVPGIISNALGGVPGGLAGVAGSVGKKLGLATGGVVRQPGWAIVGERGPELLRLPGASTVFDAQQTAMAMPAPAAMRTPRVRGSENGGDAQRVEVRVRHEPIPVTFRDEVIGEATGRAVVSYAARTR